MTNKSKIVNGVQYKQCSKCKQFKPLKDFYRFPTGSLGVTSICRDCTKQYEMERGEIRGKYQRDRYKNDPEYQERNRRRSVEWNKSHPEYCKEWKKSHLEHYREYQKEWRRTHPEHLNKYRRKKNKVVLIN